MSDRPPAARSCFWIHSHIVVKDFQFIFDAPPAQPSATSSLEEILGWSVWCAMELALKDVVFDECDEGLKVGCLDYRVRGKYQGPRYVPLARFPHMRGSPLKKLPAKASSFSFAREPCVCSQTATLS